MDSPDLIIPARFDSKDMAAGLKAVEEGGRVAGDLGQTADAASARFRKAHESVESALQQFDLLRQSLRQAPGDEDRAAGGVPAGDQATQDSGAKLSPAEWLRDTGTRLGGFGAGQIDQAGGVRQFDPFPEAAGPSRSRVEADLPALLPERAPQPIPAATASPEAEIPVGSGDANVASPVAIESSGRSVQGRSVTPGLALEPSVAIAPEDRPGFARRERPNGESAATGLEKSSERSEVLSDFRRRLGFAQGGSDTGAEVAGINAVGRMPPEVVADYRQWMAGDLDGSQDRAVAIRRAQTAGADGDPGLPGISTPANRAEPEGCHDRRRLIANPDPREGIWRVRTPSSVVPTADDPLGEGRTTWAARGGSGMPPGGRDSEARLGATSTAAIERLLREQNELIRQDLQRNANLPISAPPPMRGGGIRM